jgi:hypothetical protein
MKKLMMAGAAALTLAGALGGAAQAQPHYGQPHYGPHYGQGGGYGFAPNYAPIREELQRLEQRIERGLDSGRLTRREAVRLREDVGELRRLQAHYRRDGYLSRWEDDDLHRRLEVLKDRVRYEQRDPEQRPGYGYGHDRWDGRRY